MTGEPRRLVGPKPERVPTRRVISKDAWRLASRRALHGFQRHRGIDSAASLSFFAALAIFPLSLSVVSAFALFQTKTDAERDILQIIDSVAPQTSASLLHDPLDQLFTLPNPGYALAIGVVLSLWALSNYLTAVGRAVNTAYDVQEGRQWGLLRGYMLLVALLLMIVLGVMILLLAGTPAVAEVVVRQVGGPPWAAIVWDVLKWPLLAALAVFAVGILYYYAPNVRHLRIRWVTWGAFFAIIAWVATTIGFGLYVLNVSHYNKVYGWLGGAVVLLLWLYLSNLVVVYGAEVDAEIVRVRELEAGIDAEETVQLPLRSTYRNLKIANQLSTDIAEGRELRHRAEERRRDGRSEPGSESVSTSLSDRKPSTTEGETG